MKKNLTEMVFILDRSGSMAGLEDDRAKPWSRTKGQASVGHREGGTGTWLGSAH